MKATDNAQPFTIAAVLHWLPGEAHPEVRAGAIGFLQRLEERARREIQPHSVRSFVRGVGVSMDALLGTVLRNGQAEQFLFVTDAALQPRAVNWSVSNPEMLNGRSASFLSWQQIAEGALNDFRPDIWFDARGELTDISRLRERRSPHVYPIVSVQHGFSVHNLLWDHFTRLLLTRCYPCDSCICTTTRSQRAMRRLLSNVSERFNRDFGTNLAFPHRTDVIPLCIDTDIYAPRDKPSLRIKLGLPRDAIVLLYLGYVSATKADLIPLLRVLKTVIADNPKQRILLVIAGTGAELSFKAVMENARTLGVQRSIVVKRNITDAYKQQLIPAVDVFVSPGDSIQESFGLTPIESNVLPW